MYTFSIIVPCYNVSKYLRETLESIRNQSFIDWECWLIDDGSNDSTPIICEEYSALDSRFKVCHKSNGGVSSARNMGLDHVTGDWVLFVDGDDYIASDYLSNFSLYTNADYIVCGHTEVLSDKQNDRYVSKQDEFISLDQIPDFLSTHLHTMSCISTWAKAYKRSIIEEYKLRFDTTMRYSEDCIFMHAYLQRIQSLYIVHKTFYKFRLFKPEPTKRFTYALTHDEVLRHVNLIESAYKTLSKKQNFESQKYISFQSFVFLRCYCRKLEQLEYFDLEPLDNIKSILNHPFINNSLFGRPNSIFSKDGVYFIIYKIINVLNLHRILLKLISKYFTK